MLKFNVKYKNINFFTYRLVLCLSDVKLKIIKIKHVLYFCYLEQWFSILRGMMDVVNCSIIIFKFHSWNVYI